jgi:tRNA modification GTPase
MAHRVRLIDPLAGLPIDDGLVVVFPGPASFTGEDVVEFHLHGSPAVIDRLFAVLASLGLRAAGPGEFSRRAFANGKMDLTEAEGLADLIESDSDSQRLQALAQMGGAWAAQIADWQSRLLDALAWLEASIDFSDEDDVPDDVALGVSGTLKAVADEMYGLLSGGRRGEIVRDGLRVAIVGPPNVGKSTLLNALAGREAAIVSDVPGTTRDVVEVRLSIAGYVVVLADTAGLRESVDLVEIEGIRRARLRAEDSDLRIFVIAAGPDGSESDLAIRVGLETESLARPGDVVFTNKVDLGGVIAGPVPEGLIGVSGSALTGAGLDQLLDVLKARLTSLTGGSMLITRARHRDAVTIAHSALVRAISAPADLAAEDVRVVLQALARLLGRFDVEQVLDRIFGSFCIGK